MWCWRRTDRAKNEVLHRVRVEKKNILHTIKRRRTKRIDTNRVGLTFSNTLQKKK